MKQAVEDADTLIVRSAIELSNNTECVVMVGEDIDFLVLLSALVSSSCANIYYFKPEKGKSDHVCYSANNFKYSKHIKDKILFLHAFSGCDTTSSAKKTDKKN